MFVVCWLWFVVRCLRSVAQSFLLVVCCVFAVVCLSSVRCCSLLLCVVRGCCVFVDLSVRCLWLFALDLCLLSCSVVRRWLVFVVVVGCVLLNIVVGCLLSLFVAVCCCSLFVFVVWCFVRCVLFVVVCGSLCGV